MGNSTLETMRRNDSKMQLSLKAPVHIKGRYDASFTSNSPLYSLANFDIQSHTLSTELKYALINLTAEIDGMRPERIRLFAICVSTFLKLLESGNHGA